VTQSWILVADEVEMVGVDFFLRLFRQYPHAADLFRFGSCILNVKAGDSKNVPKSLRVHAKKVMDAVGTCVAGLTYLPDLVPTLRMLGQMHASLGVQAFHYDVVYNLLMDAIEAEVGVANFDKETREAWGIVYRSLTTIMKNPDAVLQIEPLEGWGVVNTVACACLVIFTPLQMSGIVSNGSWADWQFSLLTIVPACVLAFDMASHWIADKVRPRASPDLSKRSRARRNFDVFIYPVKFKTVSFLRSLQMNRWAKWPKMETIVL
jgi:hemoglobin-like flavoprotein